VVKRREIVKLNGPFEAEALRVLREIPGLAVTAEPKVGDRRPDFVLGYAGAKARIEVEVKHRANTATAWQLVHQARLGAPLLLIAEETTAEARQILEEHGIAAIDGLGNAHLELPGLLFHIEGQRPGHQARPTRLTGKAGVVAQALLLAPKREWQVQDLAAEAGVALGLAHRVLARLEEDGLVVTEGKGRHQVRRVENPTALLDLWAEENVDRPRRTLAHLLTQTPRQLMKKLGTSLRAADVDHALTGAGAASLLAPFITALPVVEVWVAATAASEELFDAAQADPVTDGQNVVFLQGKNDEALAFREQHDDLWLANRFRVYADLRRDPRRGREQAENLRQEVIGF
jgi:hypothetical protein